jgi:hypothetical protein
LTVQEAADALGLGVPSVYGLIDEGLIWGRKVPGYRGRPVWDLDPASVAQEKQRRAEGRPKPEPEPSRPVYIRLPDAGMPSDPDERRAFIRRLRAEALAAQED